MTQGMKQIDEYIDLGDDSEEENDEIDNGELIAMDENLAFVLKTFECSGNLNEDKKSKETLDQR